MTLLFEALKRCIVRPNLTTIDWTLGGEPKPQVTLDRRQGVFFARFRTRQPGVMGEGPIPEIQVVEGEDTTTASLIGPGKVSINLPLGTIPTRQTCTVRFNEVELIITRQE